jgi:hypothetical protein
MTEKLNKWLSLIANFGVIVGLLFLGYEIRQNTTQLRAEASYSINEGLSMINAGIYGDSELANIHVRGKADFSSLDPTERQQFVSFQFDRINLAIHYQALQEEGLADIHFPYDQFLINEFHSNPGLQQFLVSVEDTWLGAPELYEALRKK